MKKTISERALKMLETVGWCQGRPWDGAGRRCMVSAISGVSHHDYAGRYLMSDLSCVVVNPGVSVLSEWNDRPLTTFDDVREALLIGASMELSNEA